MSRYTVKVIRAAFREIQKLPYEHLELLEAIIREFYNGNFGDYRKLEGYKNLWRTKKNDLRIIWTKPENSDAKLLIIKAGQRGDVYQGVIDERKREDPFDLSQLLNIEQDKIDNIPAYEWSENSQKTWHQFVYGDYRYSPTLTDEQRSIFSELNVRFSDPADGRNKFSSLLIQSSPGTGKTICAALLASELHQERGWNVNLILPEILCKDVKEFDAIKKIDLDQNIDRFFIGTFDEWLKKAQPDIYINIATQSEELAALERVAKTSHTIKPKENLSEHDLRLYRGFIDTNEDKSSHPSYIEHRKRIDVLSKININWENELNEKKRRLAALAEFSATKPLDSQVNPSIFIIDEVQDYLIAELDVIVQMLNRWKSDYNHESLLCLLGDMNQRIYPGDFDWGHLQLTSNKSLKYNYRNTKKIIEFANIFHKFAQKSVHGRRSLPQPCDSSKAFEEGEPVRILEINSHQDGLAFLRKLNDKITQLNEFTSCSLMGLLASHISVIYSDLAGLQPEKLTNIDYLTVASVKGREFDTCIAFCVFVGEGEPSFQEANNWYTIFTRPRTRLLVIATSSELKRIGREKLVGCDFFNVDDKWSDCIEWIAKFSNSEHLFKDVNNIFNLIYEGLTATRIHIYKDTYAALDLTAVDDSKKTNIERDLIKVLNDRIKSDLTGNFKEILEKELLQIDVVNNNVYRISLKCLILRGLGHSWQAVYEASKLKEHNFHEYTRLLTAIANDLSAKGLLYEAARVRANLGIQLPSKYPFINYFDENTDSLISIICKSAIDKIGIEL